LALGVAADHDPAEALAHVPQRGGQGDDRHHLRRGGDVEAALADDPILAHAHAGDDVAQGAVVDVQDPPPGDAVPVDVEEVVVVVDVVVDHGGEQVVRGGDRVQVAGEVQVHRLHRDHLARAATGAAALDPE